MYKIYTCKYFASWSKHTHVSKSIYNLRSHANSVHISILKGTHTCCTADMYRLLMTAATGLARKTIGTKEQSHEWLTDVVKVAFTYDQWYRIKEIVLDN